MSGGTCFRVVCNDLAPEPTGHVTSVMRSDSFLRNVSRWWRNVSDLSNFAFRLVETGQNGKSIPIE